jgi:hypothetical protein
LIQKRKGNYESKRLLGVEREREKKEFVGSKKKFIRGNVD